MELVRRAQYEVFFIVHQLYIPAVILLCLHVKNVYIGFLPGIILKVVDEVTRSVAMYRAQHVINCSVEGSITFIQCHLPQSQHKNTYEYENVSGSELSTVDQKVLPVTMSRENNSIPALSHDVDYDNLGQWYFLTVKFIFHHFFLCCLILLKIIT